MLVPSWSQVEPGVRRVGTSITGQPPQTSPDTPSVSLSPSQFPLPVPSPTHSSTYLHERRSSLASCHLIDLSESAAYGNPCPSLFLPHLVAPATPEVRLLLVVSYYDKEEGSATVAGIPKPTLMTVSLTDFRYHDSILDIDGCFASTVLHT